MAEMYPIYLKLAGREVLVVGAGRVAWRKVEALLKADAAVRVVAPEVCAELRELAAEAKLVLHERQWEPDDCTGALIVVAATGDSELNARIRISAHEHNALVNAVDDPPNCDFYVPAVARFGELRLAISTQGQVPLISSRVRQYLEKALPPELADVVKSTARERERLLQSVENDRVRLRRLRAFLEAELERWGLKL
ncbi:MAG: bifunctional precorrin-2 dehydrogenase/sirohydrochlorin ferrochelatase [Planctomycetes bacterium]|nr:bifunctional precorrin-2 dehydrogenase/sirohydrochlorin ferrochelatase [Planctomycetota bacterium]